MRLGFQRIAGTDEAGRGPLAGPVVAAAVVLGDWQCESGLLNDSKKLSEVQREVAFAQIRQHAMAYRIVCVSPTQIDRMNILRASLWGMARAVQRIDPLPDYVLVDGNRYPDLEIEGQAVVKGDSKSLSIAAASILAKVARDRVMKVYGRIYPQYEFEKHKGYPTKRHRELVERHGLCPIHRKSFNCRPVQLAFDLDG